MPLGSGVGQYLGTKLPPEQDVKFCSEVNAWIDNGWLVSYDAAHHGSPWSSPAAVGCLPGTQGNDAGPAVFRLSAAQQLHCVQPRQGCACVWGEDSQMAAAAWTVKSHRYSRGISECTSAPRATALPDGKDDNTSWSGWALA